MPRTPIAQVVANAFGRPALRISAYDGSSAGPADATVSIHRASPAALSYLITAPSSLGLARAFVSVGVVEEEAHLTGVTRRDSRLAVSSPSDRRQSAQNRPSTRINVNRTSTAAGVLLPNGRTVADALLTLPNAGNPTRLVLGIADVA